MKRALFSLNRLVKTETFAAVTRPVAFPDQLHAIVGFRRNRTVVFRNAVAKEQVIAFSGFEAFETDIPEVRENGALRGGNICFDTAVPVCHFRRHFRGDSGITFIVVDPGHP